MILSDLTLSNLSDSTQHPNHPRQYIAKQLLFIAISDPDTKTGAIPAFPLRFRQGSPHNLPFGPLLGYPGRIYGRVQPDRSRAG